MYLSFVWIKAIAFDQRPTQNVYNKHSDRASTESAVNHTIVCNICPSYGAVAASAAVSVTADIVAVAFFSTFSLQTHITIYSLSEYKNTAMLLAYKLSIRPNFCSEFDAYAMNYSLCFIYLQQFRSIQCISLGSSVCISNATDDDRTFDRYAPTHQRTRTHLHICNAIVAFWCYWTRLISHWAMGSCSISSNNTVHMITTFLWNAWEKKLIKFSLHPYQLNDELARFLANNIQWYVNIYFFVVVAVYFCLYSIWQYFNGPLIFTMPNSICNVIFNITNHHLNAAFDKNYLFTPEFKYTRRYEWNA